MRGPDFESVVHNSRDYIRDVVGVEAYGHVVCAYLFGSWVTGQAREFSDIDLCAIVSAPGLWQRRCDTHGGDDFDLVIYSADRLGDVARHAVAAGNPHAIIPMVEGVAILDAFDKASEFKASFTTLYDRPPAASEAELVSLRAMLTAYVRDLRRPKSDLALKSSVLAAVDPLVRLRYRLARAWCFTGPLALPRLDVEVPGAGLAISTAVSAALVGDSASLVDLIEHALEQSGGELRNGYQSSR